jgi:(p)ppGpp synthase/HD superfamily hydrolase
MKKGELLNKMLIIAVNAHADQYDKGGHPYILHPISVLHMLRTEDEELQCIALGHDLIEDTKTTYQDLRDAGMTERIIEGIRSLTKLPGETYEEYKQKVLANKDAIAVKKKDIQHNTDIRRLRGVSDKDIRRMERYFKFYVELADADGH